MRKMELTLQSSVLEWARIRAGLERDALAGKLKISADRVRRWEQTGRINFSDAEKLARITHTPIGLLYLERPPEEKLPVPDFRTVGGEAVGQPSPDLLETIHLAQARQDWFREYLLIRSADPLSWVGSLDTSNRPRNAAEQIRAAVGLDTRTRAQAATWEEALRLLVEQIEEQGVLVLRSGVVGSNNRRPLSVKEFRGFALSDSFAPLIFINGRDTKSAQLFSLMHEFAHLWLGVSGVSNLRRTYAPNSTTELWCNAVAGELLVPTAELQDRLPAAERTTDPVAALCPHFRVSSLVVLRRLKDIGAIDGDTFRERYKAEERKFRALAAKQAERGGGDYYATQRVRVSPRFARALIESTLEGHTAYREALHLLGLSKVETLRKFAQDLKLVG